MDADEIVKALRCNNAPDEPDNLGCANKKCKYRDVDGACDLVSMCGDAASMIERLNDFQNNHLAKTIARVTELNNLTIERIAHNPELLQGDKHT